jgi:predicted AAA+ superfamily ATPase
MAELKGFDIRHAKKMLQLLYVVAQSVPFKPNINKLAEKTGIHRNSINNYLYFLHEAKLVELLHQAGSSMATLQKPEKIYMENTNLLFALSESPPSKGTVREVFFNNQLSGQYKVTHSPITDFEVDSRYSFEIGGQNKGRKQIASLAKAWVVKDDLEYPVGNALPLWIFGFLY